MKIQRLTEKHYLESLRLSEYAFQYKVTEDEMANRLESLKGHSLFGIFDGDKLAAKYHLFPFEIFIGTEKMKMGGIAGVATYPEYRRNGYVKALLTHSLEEMKNEGYSLSMLHPFSVSFYRKYGWELFTNQLKSTLTKSHLRMFDAVPGTFKRFKKKTHSPDIENIYNAYAKKHTGMLVRKTKYWTNKIYDELTCAVYYNANHEPMGYVLYEIEDSKMTVEEFVPLNLEARKGLWNFICQHDSMIDEITLTTPEKEPLFFMLQEPRVKSELVPYGMVRIVDVEAFLQGYSFHWHHQVDEIALHIKDDYAPWNNKTFIIKDQKVCVLDKEVPKNAIQLTINALSTMLFGYKRPQELYELGIISGNQEIIKQLEDFIPTHQQFIYDYF